jgi:hypothetical protein
MLGNERLDGMGMNPRTLLLVGLVFLAALARLVPHPPNFAPIGAMALFGGAHFRNRWAAFLVPLTAMLLSDCALEAATRLGLLQGWMATGWGFHRGMWYVYGSVALSAALGLLLRGKLSVWSVGGAVLGSSVLFFVITNLGTWLEWDMYPRSAEGLLACYVAAVPFFHWTLLGDAVYATVLFGGFALAEKRLAVLQPASG